MYGYDSIMNVWKIWFIIVGIVWGIVYLVINYELDWIMCVVEEFEKNWIVY